MTRLVALSLAGWGCAQAVPPVDIRGVVFDPEAYLAGDGDDGVAGAQLYMAEDETRAYAAISGESGAYEMRDVPANYNWHPIAIREPEYLRTLDGLGTLVSDADPLVHWIPLLRLGPLAAAIADWIGVEPSQLATLGLIVVAVMDRRPPEGRFLRENVAVAIGSAGSALEDGAGCPDSALRVGYVVEDAGSFEVVDADLLEEMGTPGGVPPDGFAGMAAVTGPLGCIVTADVTDKTGALAFLAHDMAIDNRAAMFQLYVAE